MSSRASNPRSALTPSGDRCSDISQPVKPDLAGGMREQDVLPRTVRTLDVRLDTGPGSNPDDEAAFATSARLIQKTAAAPHESTYDADRVGRPRRIGRPAIRADIANAGALRPAKSGLGIKDHHRLVAFERHRRDPLGDRRVHVLAAMLQLVNEMSLKSIFGNTECTGDSRLRRTTRHHARDRLPLLRRGLELRDSTTGPTRTRMPLNPLPYTTIADPG